MTPHHSSRAGARTAWNMSSAAGRAGMLAVLLLAGCGPRMKFHLPGHSEVSSQSKLPPLTLEAGEEVRVLTTGYENHAFNRHPQMVALDPVLIETSIRPDQTGRRALFLKALRPGKTRACYGDLIPEFVADPRGEASDEATRNAVERMRAHLREKRDWLRKYERPEGQSWVYDRELRDWGELLNLDIDALDERELRRLVLEGDGIACFDLTITPPD